MKYDAIVIGSGLGGLTAAAWLAKAGKRVLVIERHYAVGGCATVFKRHDFTVEVGLHELDGFIKGDSKSYLFDQLGIFDGVEFVKIPEFYRYTNGRVDITIPHGVQEVKNTLIGRFPDQRVGIQKYFETVTGISDEVNSMPRSGIWAALAAPFFPILYPKTVFNAKTSVGGLLDRLFDDEEIKLTLGANIGYYHDDPYEASLFYWAMAQTAYHRGGGYFIKGGSQKLSDHLASVVVKHGGEVIKRHKVTQIIAKYGRAAGVKFERVSGKKGQIDEAYADVVIANAPVPDVVNNMAPSLFPEKFRAKVKSLELAPSILSIYLGFDKPPRELGCKHYSTMVMDGDIRSLKDISTKVKEPFRYPGFGFVDYSQIDSGLAPESKSLGVIASLDYLSHWEGLSDEGYKKKKDEVTAKMIERLDRVYPGIKDHIVYAEAGTPKTIKRFTLNPGGTAYGFAQTPSQAAMNRIAVKAPAEDLYFASAWAFPGGGFTGAMLGGWEAARKAIKDKGW